MRPATATRAPRRPQSGARRPATARPLRGAGRTTREPETALPRWLRERKERPLDAGYRLSPRAQKEYQRAITEASLREQQHVEVLGNPVTPAQLELLPIDLMAAEGARDCEYYSSKAFQFRVHGELQDAIRSYDRAARLSPGDCKALLNRGVLLYRCGRWAAATASFERALAVHPQNPQLLYNLAVCHLQREQYAEAEPLLTRAIAVLPDPRFFRARALSYRKRGLFSRAVDNYVLAKGAGASQPLMAVEKGSGIKNAYFSEAPLFTPLEFQLAQAPPEGPAPYVLARICDAVLLKEPEDRSPAEVQMLLDLMARFPSWSGDGDEQAALVRQARRVKLPVGGVLYEAGAPATGRYVLVRGRLAQYPGRTGPEPGGQTWELAAEGEEGVLLAGHVPGADCSFVEGEAAVGGDDERVRSATMVATEPCVLAYLSHAAARRVSHAHQEQRLEALVEFMRGVSVLSLLSDRETRALAERARTVTVAREHVLVEQGAVPEGLFVIRQGRVRVAAQRVVLETLGQRQSFGEQAVLRVNREEARSTCAYVAMEPTELVVLSKAALFEGTSYLARQSMRNHCGTGPRVSAQSVLKAKALWGSYKRALLSEVVYDHKMKRAEKRAHNVGTRHSRLK